MEPGTGIEPSETALAMATGSRRRLLATHSPGFVAEAAAVAAAASHGGAVADAAVLVGHWFGAARLPRQSRVPGASAT